MKNNIKLPCTMYIADCVEDGGIYTYSLSENGIATQLSYTKEDRPTFITVDGNRLHAVLREPAGFDGNSATVSYGVSDDGSLSDRTTPITTGGKVACHISALDGNIYTANYISGSVCRQGDDAISHIGSGPVADRQEGPHCHFIAPSPDNKYLFAVDLGNDTIYTYDKQLCEVSTAKVPCGHGCRHLTASEDGRYVYCVNELASTVSVFEYKNGELTLLDTYDALPDDFDGFSKAAAIRVSGDYLYVSNRGHDSIVSFRIEGDRLVRLCFTSSGGDSPRDFNICGDILVCTNEDSGNVTFFKVDCGILTKLPNELKLNRPLCVVFK